MGCDIHAFAERLNEQGVWEFAPAQQDYKYFMYADQGECYTGRNYHLFSLLANVRGGNPEGQLGERRGIPQNCSEHWREYTERWSCDLHSHSWYTLAELLAFPWENGEEVEGYIPKAWDEAMQEDNQEVTADMLESKEKLLALLEKFDDKWDDEKFVYYKFFDSHARNCSAFVKGTLPFLQSLGEPDKVRMVFAFDN